MLKKTGFIIMLSLFLMTTFNVPELYADKYVLSLTSSNITTHSPIDPSRGNYYTLQFELPEIMEGKELHAAILEFCRFRFQCG